MISKGRELNLAGRWCPLMMETSGHGALQENHYLDDGAYMATKVGGRQGGGGRAVSDGRAGQVLGAVCRVHLVPQALW